MHIRIVQRGTDYILEKRESLKWVFIYSSTTLSDVEKYRDLMTAEKPMKETVVWQGRAILAKK